MRLLSVLPSLIISFSRVVSLVPWSWYFRLGLELIPRGPTTLKVSKCFALNSTRKRRPNKVEMIWYISKPEQTIYMAINYMGKKMQVRSHKVYLMSEPQQPIHQIVTSQSLPFGWLVPRGWFLVESKVPRPKTIETRREKEMDGERSTDNSQT